MYVWGFFLTSTIPLWKKCKVVFVLFLSVFCTFIVFSFYISHFSSSSSSCCHSTTAAHTSQHRRSHTILQTIQQPHSSAPQHQALTQHKYRIKHRETGVPLHGWVNNEELPIAISWPVPEAYGKHPGRLSTLSQGHNPTNKTQNILLEKVYGDFWVNYIYCYTHNILYC